MILSSTTLTAIIEKPSLFDDVNYICGVTSDDYSDADKLRNTNKWLYKFAVEAWKADGSWIFDDKNHTDFPIAYSTLIDGQADYTMPTDLLKIERVSYLNSSGDYVDLEYIDKRNLPDIGNDESGIPVGYYLIGPSLFLNPKPSTSLLTATKGLRVYFKRKIVELTKNDASTSLGVPEQFVDFISNGVAREYLKKNDMKRLLVVDADIERIKLDIREDYAKRMLSKNPRAVAKTTNYE